MDTAILWQLFLQLILILLNAVFACAEIAVLSIGETKLSYLAAEGNKSAIRLAKLTNQPARFLATIQVAITLSGFLGSAFAADNFSDKLVSLIAPLNLGIASGALKTISVILITMILSFVTLVFGELVPKRLAMKKPEAIAMRISRLVSFISKLFAPIVWLLTVSTNGILRLLGIDPNSEDSDVTEEEIRMMVDAGSEKGSIDIEEKQLIQNVFEFDDITAGEIATHRTDMVFLWSDEDEAAWDNIIHESRHSLYPVCGESVDDVIGILNAKDYFRMTDKSRDNVMKYAVRPAYFVPEGVKADILFRNMKKQREYFAVVLDEYGGLYGIITMSDLIEQLVGEIEDIDENALDIEQTDNRTWKISGSASLDDVREKLGIVLECDEYETFGGLVFGLLESIPEDGSTFELDTDGLHIKVLEVSDHRIVSTMVTLTEVEEA